MNRLFKKIVALAMVLSMLVCCLPSFAEEDAMAEYRTGSPWLCSVLDGVLTEEIVSKTSLKDDFYTAVVGESILNLTINEAYGTAGTSMDISLIGNERLLNLFSDRIENPEGDAQLAYNLFDLMMDWDTRNETGVSCLMPKVEEMEKLESIEDYFQYLFVKDWSDSIGHVVSGVPDTWVDDTSTKCISVDITSLILGDSAEYIHPTETGESKKLLYSYFAQTILQKLGYSEEEAAKKVENAFAFETLLAPYLFTDAQRAQPDIFEKLNNPLTREEVTELAGGIPVLEIIEKAEGFPAQEKYNVYYTDAVANLSSILTDDNLTLLKDWAIVQYVIGYAEYTDIEAYKLVYMVPDETADADVIAGSAADYAQSVSDMLTWPVARLYAESYLSQTDKDRITEVCLEIQQVYHDIIQSADFLSEETKSAAVEKLEAIEFCVLYPDDWSEYEMQGLEILSPAEGGTLLGAIESYERYMMEKTIREFSAPATDATAWSQSPQTVNCFYDASANRVYILGAMATGQMYNPEMCDEELYGALGMFIGHEVSHAFDSSGAQFDKDGNMSMWWTEEDYMAFLEKNQALSDYFSAMYPWEGQEFYGEIMTGEACADMGGMRAMLAIAAEKENFDYDLFFRTYAATWCYKGVPEAIYSGIYNEHPLYYLRTNAVLQQFDEFLDFYGIEEGDGMYLSAENRVRIW